MRGALLPRAFVELPICCCYCSCYQVQVPKHVLRVFSDEGGQEKVEIQVLLPGECCCCPACMVQLM